MPTGRAPGPIFKNAAPEVPTLELPAKTGAELNRRIMAVILANARIHVDVNVDPGFHQGDDAFLMTRGGRIVI